MTVKKLPKVSEIKVKKPNFLVEKWQKIWQGKEKSWKVFLISFVLFLATLTWSSYMPSILSLLSFIILAGLSLTLMIKNKRNCSLVIFEITNLILIILFAIVYMAWMPICIISIFVINYGKESMQFIEKFF